MEVSKEDLEQITTLAAAAYTPSQVAFAMGIPKSDFEAEMMNSESDICIAFMTGLNSGELAVRQSMFKLAVAGSSPAQTMFMKLFDETRKILAVRGFTEE